MRHFVMTRASYGPEWDLETNRRRLKITAAVTARLMGLQTNYDWTWCVLLDERDPFLERRSSLFEAFSPNFLPVLWTPSKTSTSQHGGLLQVEAEGQLLMRGHLPVDDTVLQTRLDDDDGLAPDAIQRIQDAVRQPRDRRRVALMFPAGFRVWNGRMTPVRHETNAMHTLVTQPGDTLSVFGYSHRLVGENASVVTIDRMPGWLWVRHRDTDSGMRQADVSISKRVRDMFPVDWSALAEVWR